MKTSEEDEKLRVEFNSLLSYLASEKISIIEAMFLNFNWKFSEQTWRNIRLPI